MRPRRPRRRGDWGRRLSSLSALDSPLSSDSDGFPCDSSCSSDSFSSQDLCLSDRLPRRLRSSPHSGLSSLLEPSSYSPSRTVHHPHPHDLPPAHRPDSLRPRLAQLDIRDLSLSEYAAAELPDIGIFLKGMLPGFGMHSQPPYAMQGGSSSRGGALQRRRSVPPSAFRNHTGSVRPPRDIDKLKNRPPTFPDAGRPSQLQVQFARKHEVVPTATYPRDQSPRQEGTKRLRRSSSPTSRSPRLSPKVDTRRYADDIAISRVAAQRRDPDSMQRCFLMERLLSMYHGFVGLNGRNLSYRR